MPNYFAKHFFFSSCFLNSGGFSIEDQQLVAAASLLGFGQLLETSCRTHVRTQVGREREKKASRIFYLEPERKSRRDKLATGSKSSSYCVCDIESCLLVAIFFFKLSARRHFVWLNLLRNKPPGLLAIHIH